MKLLKALPRLVGGMGAGTQSKPRAGSLSLLGGTPTATLGHAAAPLFEGSYELAVRPKPPPVSLASTGELGERTMAILQHEIPLILNSLLEVVLQDGFLQFINS